MRSLRSLLAALALAATLAACDSSTPEAEAPVLGTWVMTETAYRVLATAAEDVTYVSPFHPAEGTLAVSGLDVPALRYVVRTERPGEACAAGCRPRVEIWSRPFRGRQLPDRAELTLEHPRQLDLRVYTDHERDSYNGPVEYTLTPTTLTVPATAVRYGSSTVGELSGTLELPLRTLTAGVEAEVQPYDPNPGPAAAVGVEIRLTFAPDGTYERTFDDSVTGRVTTEPGTWAWVDGRVEITSDADGPMTTTAYDVDVSGDTLELTAWAQGLATEQSRYERDLRIPQGTLSDVRYEFRQTARRAAL